MRSFNKPLAILMSTATLAGGAPAVAGAEAAVSAPEVFQACAQLALDGNAANPTADGGPTTVFNSPQRDQAGYGLEAGQDSRMVTPDGTDCIGVGGLKDTLELRTGSFTQAIRGASVKIVYDNELIDAGQPAKDYIVGTFSYRRVCSIAMSRKVALVVKEDRSYSEAGYPTAHDSSTSLDVKLPCVEPRQPDVSSEPVAQASS